MNTQIWKYLFLSVILITGITHLASAQKYEVVPQSKYKKIYGLQLKEGWPKEMLKLKSNEFHIKGNTLWVSDLDKYAISQTTTGFILHEKGSTPAFSAQDDNKKVASGAGLDVYFVCSGCWVETECLVGSSNGNLVCTGCSDGLCDPSWQFAPTTKPVLAVTTPSGGF